MNSKANKFDEVEKLLVAYKACNDNKKKKLLHIKIVEISMLLVKRIAIPLSFQSNIPTEDLTQVGSIGLIKAIEFYDANKNTKFKTYASYLIRGEIRHYLRDKASIIKAPRRLQELVVKISAAIKSLKESGFEEPSEEQIAINTGLPLNKIHDVMGIELCKTIISLDQNISSVEDDDLTLIDKIPSEDYQEFINSCENKMMIAGAIKKLSGDLKEIIELSYYHDLNQREIAQRLKISQMQVSRRLKKALSRMYEIIKKEEDV